MRQPAPLPPPFPVGTRVRYRGTRNVSVQDPHTRALVPVLYPGAEFIIDETRDGRQGTGRLIDIDDSGEPIRDTTRDGYSIYHCDTSDGMRAGRVIWPQDAGEWEAVPGRFPA